ncbi:hypothetical protein COCNU_scaffold020187G000020 [Cocos nucifera]|nr:hypothetical protein [Cocos nucifera]
MEDFQASKEFVNEKVEFVMEFYTIIIQECQARVVGHYPNLDHFFLSDDDDDDIGLNHLPNPTLEVYKIFEVAQKEATTTEEVNDWIDVATS